MSGGEHTGREEEEEGASDIRSGKDMSKYMCISLLGTFIIQERNEMFAWMSFSSSPSIFGVFFLPNDFDLHNLTVFLFILLLFLCSLHVSI